MKTIILTSGLPQSGKSTWANSQGHPIINRDSIRFAISPSPRTIRYFKEEDRVSEIECIMVDALFKAGHNEVIVDATHLKLKYIDRWGQFAFANGYIVKMVTFKTSLEVCVKRAKKNFPEDTNFPNVIYNMWRTREIDYHIPEA
jgi:predicted kinase